MHNVCMGKIMNYGSSVEQVQIFLFSIPFGRHIVFVGRQIMKLYARIVFKNPIVTNGYKLCWDSSVTFGDLFSFSKSQYEVDTFALIKNLVKEGMCVIDIGANRGYYTMFLAKSVREKGKVYAVEPQKCNQVLIDKSIKQNKFSNVKIIPYALSNRVGNVPFYVEYKGAGTGSIYKEREDRIKHKYIIEAVTLDYYFEKEGWPKVDLIKMDIEGAEKSVLEGGKEFFLRNPQAKLIVEFCPTVLYRIGITCESFFESLQKVGFNKFFLIREKLYQIDLTVGLQDIIDRVPINGFDNIYCYRD
jgi:FkbM family methyltransferase